MVIECPRCQARYDFPLQELPDDGLRAKCARCGFVVRVTRNGVRSDDARADEVRPAQAGYSHVRRRSGRPSPVAPVSLETAAPEPPPEPPPSAEPAVPKRPGRALNAVAERSEPSPPVVAATPEPEHPATPDPMADLLEPEHEGGLEELDSGMLETPAPTPMHFPVPQERSRPLTLPPGAPREPALADEPAEAVAGELGSTRLRPERELEKEPSIIIDMGTLAEAPPEPQRPPSEPEPAAGSPPEAAPRAPRRPFVSAQTVVVAAAERFPSDDDDLPVIPGRRSGRYALVALLLVVVGFVAYVWSRNAWGPVWRDPGLALSVAFSERPAPATAPPPVQVATATPVTGELRIEGLELEWLPVKKTGAALLRGRLVNATNVTQAAITIEASLERDGLPLKQRVVACCDALAGGEAESIAQNPEHPHFSTRFNNLSRVRIEPGERRAFAVVFPNLDDGAAAGLAPAARVKFSEPQRSP